MARQIISTARVANYDFHNPSAIPRGVWLSILGHPVRKSGVSSNVPELMLQNEQLQRKPTLDRPEIAITSTQALESLFEHDREPPELKASGQSEAVHRCQQALEACTLDDLALRLEY